MRSGGIDMVAGAKFAPGLWSAFQQAEEQTQSVEYNRS